MRLRATASAALAALVVLAVSGCGLLTPQATLKRYDPSDGVGTSIGKVDVRNALAIAGTTQRTSGQANLVMTAINTGSSAVTLRVQYPSGDRQRTLRIRLQPGSNKIGYGEDGQRILSGFQGEPGSLARIYFQYGSFQGTQLKVPVLDDSWSSYSDLGPTPTPRPTSTNPPVTPAPIPPAPTATPAP